jgi:hypothetical protein
MVLALLDGRKTQTRRLATSPLRRAQAGDRLYVRENFHPWTGSASRKTIVYVADGQWIDWGSGWTGKPEAQFLTPMTPSIHMPRWASRLTLTVTGVLFHRLSEISREDAQAEGVEGRPFHWRDYLDPLRDLPSPLSSYRSLWASLHGTESLHSDPEVVALEFEVARGNIDA